MWNFGPSLLVMLFVSATSYAVAPPVVNDPLKGVVVGENVVTCAPAEGKSFEAYVHLLHKYGKAPGRMCAMCDRSPFRWQIGQGAVWLSDDDSGFGSGHGWGGGSLARVDLPLFLQMKHGYLDGFAYSTSSPAAMIRAGLDTNSSLYFDYVPTGKFEVRQFILTNEPTTPRPEEIHSPEAVDDPPRPVKKPDPWTFSCQRYESRTNSNANVDQGDTVLKDWTPEWSTPAAFTEPFQALSLGDDYYFVTRSGALYRAAKPAKGTARVLTPVWYGKKQPIKAFITDAKTGKTFLFVPPAKEGGKRAFFELSDKPRLVEYDPKLVPLPPLEEPHRTIVHAARILVALKKIEGTLPAKEKP